MRIFIALFIGIFGCANQLIIDDKSPLVSELSHRTTKLTQQEIKQLDSVNVGFQLRGGCYAYSNNKNAKPSNGEAHSYNLPKQIDKEFPRHGFYLVINQNEFIKIDSNKLGCKLYLVNTSDSVVTLNASDSRLYIIAEALNEDNVWVPITYLLSSWCGNSYHTVVLDKDEFWEFDIPVFKGKFKTKIRYTLTINKEKKICSNEIDAYINKEQLDPKKQQGYSRQNLMDPYDD